MKETKRRMELFSFYDRTGLERHLARMAQRGWLLCEIGQLFWHYRRIEPKTLRFCVCYFPKATVYDPGPSEGQEEFYSMCAHAGWVLAGASGQLQVFCNEQENPVPIDTDPALEVEAIHQAAKKGWLLSLFLLLGVGALNFGQFLWRLFDDPVGTLSSPLHLFSLVCWPVLIFVEGVDLITYFRWRHGALRAAARGEFLTTKSHPALQMLALTVVLAGLVWCLSCLRGGMLTMMVMMLVCTFGIVFVVMQLRELLKRYKASAGVNRAVIFGACVILPVIMVVLVTALVLTSGGRWLAGSDEPPLALADLTETPADGELDQDVRLTQSPLLAVLTASQYLRLGRSPGAPVPHWLQYTVIEVKAPFLYGLCRDAVVRDRTDSWNRNLPEGEGYLYQSADPAPWGAAEAYQWTSRTSGAGNTYLLCYPGRIVEIEFDAERPPTSAQMAVVAEKLGRGPL